MNGEGSRHAALDQSTPEATNSFGGPIAVDWKQLDSIVLADARVTRRPDGVVRVPYFDESRREVNAKLHGARGCWWEQRGVGVIPYGLDRLAPQGARGSRLMWIAEGESDTLALRAHYPAWRSSPVDVVGCPGSSSWQPGWVRLLDGYAGVYVFPDGDSAGERFADAVRACVPLAVHVSMPAGRDARDVLQQDAASLMDNLVLRGEQTAFLSAGIQRCRTLDELEAWLGEFRWS